MTALTFFAASPFLPEVNAQSTCTDLSTGYGRANYSLSSVQSGSQRLWVRVKGTDGTPTLKYNLSGGGTSCDQTMTTSSATNWKWVQSTNNFTTTGGTVSVQLSATEAGVGVDCFVLTSDTSFLPTDVSGCQGPQVDTTAPSISFTAPASGATVSGTTNITASASDAESNIASVVFSVVGRSDLTLTDTTAPYEWSLSTLSISNGSMTLSVAATNGAGLTTSTTRQVTVSNASNAIADTNGDSKVNIFDLSFLLSKWNTTNATADFNHDGRVNIFDLSYLLAQWGRDDTSVSVGGDTTGFL